jgi:hypothetical protein
MKDMPSCKCLEIPTSLGGEEEVHLSHASQIPNFVLPKVYHMTIPGYPIQIFDNKTSRKTKQFEDRRSVVDFWLKIQDSSP